MKYSNNNPELFVEGGSEASYIVGSIQALTAGLVETLNIYLLTYQHSVAHAIIHFVSVEIIAEVSKLYFEGMKTSHKLTEVLHSHPKIKNRGADIPFGSRSCFHKGARCFYVMTRIFFIAVIFYFIPFLTLLLQWLTPVEYDGAEH